jgi:hypothetical protein
MAGCGRPGRASTCCWTRPRSTCSPWSRSPFAGCAWSSRSPWTCSHGPSAGFGSRRCRPRRWMPRWCCSRRSPRRPGAPPGPGSCPTAGCPRWWWSTLRRPSSRTPRTRAGTTMPMACPAWRPRRWWSTTARSTSPSTCWACANASASRSSRPARSPRRTRRPASGSSAPWARAARGSPRLQGP